MIGLLFPVPYAVGAYAQVTVTSGFQMQNILHFTLYLNFASWLKLTNNNLSSLFVVVVVDL